MKVKNRRKNNGESTLYRECYNGESGNTGINKNRRKNNGESTLYRECYNGESGNTGTNNFFS